MEKRNRGGCGRSGADGVAAVNSMMMDGLTEKNLSKGLQEGRE